MNLEPYAIMTPRYRNDDYLIRWGVGDNETGRAYRRSLKRAVRLRDQKYQEAVATANELKRKARHRVD